MKRIKEKILYYLFWILLIALTLIASALIKLEIKKQTWVYAVGVCLVSVRVCAVCVFVCLYMWVIPYPKKQTSWQTSLKKQKVYYIGAWADLKRATGTPSGSACVWCQRGNVGRRSLGYLFTFFLLIISNAWERDEIDAEVLVYKSL